MSNEPIGVFLQTPFPRRIRMSKVDIGRQSLSDILVFGELQSVVIGDGVDLVLIRSQPLYDALTHQIGVFGI